LLINNIEINERTYEHLLIFQLNNWVQDTTKFQTTCYEYKIH